MNNLSVKKFFLSEGLLGPTPESRGQGSLRVRPSGCRRMSWGWFRGTWDNLKALLAVDVALRPRRHAPSLSRRDMMPHPTPANWAGVPEFLSPECHLSRGAQPLPRGVAGGDPRPEMVGVGGCGWWLVLNSASRGGRGSFSHCGLGRTLPVLQCPRI